MIPSFTSGCPSFALSLARRMVQAMAISHPPPSANPLMQAITGLPRFSIRLSTLCPRCVYSLPETASCCANSPMSAPAMNAFSPAPLRISLLESSATYAPIRTHEDLDNHHRVQILSPQIRNLGQDFRISHFICNAVTHPNEVRVGL